MTIKEFIEKAIEGDYNFNLDGTEQITRIDVDSATIDGKFYIHFFDKESDMFSYDFFRFILDPKAWEAVGKIENWIDTKYNKACGKIYIGRPIVNIHRQDWKKKMHKMIDHLIDGGTIESYIKTL